MAIDLTPPGEEIIVRSGDRKSFRLVPSSTELWNAMKGHGWLAQVRSKESSDTVAFELEVLEEADALVITIPETTNTVWGQSSKTVWEGVYDIQGMVEGTSPVTIFAEKFIIERDVSRV